MKYFLNPSYGIDFTNVFLVDSEIVVMVKKFT